LILFVHLIVSKLVRNNEKTSGNKKFREKAGQSDDEYFY
jgi:hypothetical protein